MERKSSDGKDDDPLVQLRDAFLELLSCTPDKYHSLAQVVGREWSFLGIPDTCDPVDDFILLLHVYAGLSDNKPRLYASAPKKEGVIVGMACRAAMLFPGGWDESQWQTVIQACLSYRYGGTRVRIRKNPSAAKMQAAKTMTPKQLMKEFGISRAHAYRLVARKK